MQFMVNKDPYIIMRCPALNLDRNRRRSEILNVCGDLGYNEIFEVTLGVTPEGYTFDTMLEIRVEIRAFISRAYRAALKQRQCKGKGIRFIVLYPPKRSHDLLP